MSRFSEQGVKRSHAAALAANSARTSGQAADEGVRLLVLSTNFPSKEQPVAGVFIRERMFRVAQHLPIVVVAPQAWFPLQGLIRFFRPHFRRMAASFEMMDGIEVHRPRFLCVPGILKWSDGFLMAVSIYLTVRKLTRRHRSNLLDVHFGYPEGCAGALLGKWLHLPVVVTLRGKEHRQVKGDMRRGLVYAVRSANRLITVSEPLRKVALELGADPSRVSVIGNGVDLQKFTPVPQAEARAKLGLPADAQVIISVGTLLEGKGFHRVLECLPDLLARHPKLHYLIVGGAGAAGDYSAQLREQVRTLNIGDHVHFLGPCLPELLREPLSAADVFVLATAYEGWANVFLEAMACGLPVVSTRVGGNEQVVASPEVGQLVTFGDRDALSAAIGAALDRVWDRQAIRRYAEANSWDARIPLLLDGFRRAIREADEPSGRMLADGSR
jgi:glycosyltransferase involved in cell wall biosynthesis